MVRGHGQLVLHSTLDMTIEEGRRALETSDKLARLPIPTTTKKGWMAMSDFSEEDLKALLMVGTLSIALSEAVGSENPTSADTLTYLPALLPSNFNEKIDELRGMFSSESTYKTMHRVIHLALLQGLMANIKTTLSCIRDEHLTVRFPQYAEDLAEFAVFALKAVIQAEKGGEELKKAAGM